MSSLSLFNKLISIVNNEYEINNDKTISGGVMLGETVDNLTGGSVQQKTKSEPVIKNLDENLFEGGDNIVNNDNEQQEVNMNNDNDNEQQEVNMNNDNDNEQQTDTQDNEQQEVNMNNNEDNNDDNYTAFLQRLRTNQIYKHNISGGNHKDNNEVNKDDKNNDDNSIDILPMFPYLVRY